VLSTAAMTAYSRSRRDREILPSGIFSALAASGSASAGSTSYASEAGPNERNARICPTRPSRTWGCYGRPERGSGGPDEVAGGDGGGRGGWDRRRSRDWR